MTEQQWVECTDPTKMLEFLGDKASTRKLLLFACDCCRRILAVYRDQRLPAEIEVVESFAAFNAANFIVRAP